MENNNNFINSVLFKIGFLALCLALALYLLTSIFGGTRVQGRNGGGMDQVPHFVVTGEGKADVVPNLSVFTFEVRKEAKTAADSQNQVNTILNALTDKVKAAGIAEKDIKTMGYNTYPVYGEQSRGICTPTFCPPTTSVIRGFETSVSVEVKVRDAEKVGDIISLVTTNGATSVGSVAFTVEDEEAVKAEARRKAIADAKEKAEILANDLDVRIVRIINFGEENMNYPFRSSLGGKYMDAAVPQSAVSAELPMGQNEFTSRVTIWYEIR